MNRRYWLDYIDEDPYYPARAVILDIFDDVDTRTCNNCIYRRNQLPSGGKGLCPYFSDATTILPDYEFGCNQFERFKK